MTEEYRMPKAVRSREAAIDPTINPAKIDPAKINPADVHRSQLPRSEPHRFSSLPRWVPRSWQFWGAFAVLGFSGLGVFSALTLFSLPDTPNCPAIFLPTASASARLYCAQNLADKRTVESLLKAIDLVNELPSDHPLRPEIDRSIEHWAKEILTLAGELFHSGDLQKAVDTAKRIPADTAAHQRVEQQVKDWQDLWAKAEKIYQEAEDAMRNNDLRQAFLTSTRLLSVGNKYWETTKYQELTTLIAETRTDGGKLDKAKGLAEQGGLENVLAAIQLVNEIQPKSHLYQEATGLIADFGRRLLDLADAALDNKNYNQAVEALKQIPDRANLKSEIQDFNLLAQARAQAWGGTVDDLQSAILQAQKLKSDRPLYGKAQQLAGRWQLEIQDIAYLERAQQLAQPGAVHNLAAAIEEARQIAPGNPRGQEAEEAIDRWTDSMQTIEDQPYIHRAEQYARSGDMPSLQRAINEANQVGAGRALSDQADQLIQGWTAQIQRLQDQPLLDRAEQLASAGNLSAAIATAEQVGEGRALSNEAQTQIDGWTSRQATNVQAYSPVGQNPMQQAYNSASLNTSSALLSAIQLANQIPLTSLDRTEANRMIDQWSFQLLQIAEDQAAYNLAEAIVIAESIPPGTRAYAAAQREARAWRQR